MAVHRIRPTDSRGIEGYTLIEVVVALLVSAIIATAVMSVALTAKMNGGQNGKNDRREIAGQAVKNVSAALRNFVSGCCDVYSGCVIGSGLPYSCLPIRGPNLLGAYGGWTFDGYPLAAGPVGDPGFAGRYALLASATPHNLTNVLPSWFTSAPYNAQLSYTVNPGGVGYTLPAAATYPTNKFMPQVSIQVNWTEPASP